MSVRGHGVVALIALAGLGCGRLGFSPSNTARESGGDIPTDRALDAWLDGGGADSVGDALVSDPAVMDFALPDSGVDVPAPDASGTGPDALRTPRCGDGIIDPGELCDRATVGMESCATRGLAGGQLRCLMDCRGYDLSNCGATTCGDGRTDPGEACDGADVNGLDCATVAPGFTAGGTLRCLADCTSYDVSGCRTGLHYVASSCAEADVVAAIALAADGDTVDVPAGTCAWANTLVLDRGVSLIGAGIGRTTIIDATTPLIADPYTHGDTLIEVTEPRAAPARLSGFTFEALNGTTGFQIHAARSPVRIDHCRFVFVAGAPAFLLFAFHAGPGFGGVFDHNVFENNHDEIGVSADGAAGWARPLAYGTAHAVFAEDNIVRRSGGAYQGFVLTSDAGRVVARYNDVNTGFLGSLNFNDYYRGGLSAEVYSNVSNGADFAVSFIGAGTGVFFSNEVTTTGMFVRTNEERTCDYIGPARCDGRLDISAGPLRDGNVPLPNGSGTQSGVPSANVLADPGQTWTPGEWVGRYVHNVARAADCLVTANTATTVTCTLSGGAIWTSGDRYKLVDGYPCLDQVGRAPDENADGVQELRPVYEWANVVLGGGIPGIGIHDPFGCVSPSMGDHVAEGREYFVNTPAPGYRSYVYPHPMVRIAP